MKQTKQQRREYYNRLFFKSILVLVSTLLITYFLPHDDGFSYEYDVDRPWRYNSLIATYQFPIYKEASVVEHERDSVMHLFQPYYTMNREVSKKSYQILYDEKLQELKAKHKDYKMYLRYIHLKLDTIYSSGVMQGDNYAAMVSGGFSAIRIVKDNEAYVQPFAHIYSTRSAYEYIMNVKSSPCSRQVLQEMNINELISANLTRDDDKSQAEKEDLLASISAAKGMVLSGQKIIDKGEIITQETYNILKSYEKEASKHQTDDVLQDIIYIGKSIFIFFLMITLMSYVEIFRKDYIDVKQSAIMAFGLITLFSIFAALMVSHKILHIFVLPVSMVPIIIRVFLDSRTAFMFHCALSLIISLMLEMPYEYLLLQISVGMIAIQSLRELSQRSQIIRTAALISLAYIGFYISFEVGVVEDWKKIDNSIIYYFIVSGILLLFTYPLLYIIEKSFHFVSDVTLVELSNINNPLLQQMTEIAPGTFQHSMQVSNLAVEVARKIGARPQLVRTGALYHDIGKLERPVFFTENQSGISPHKHLSPQKSAEVIIAHVTNGISLANKHNLPASIKRFICTHHGLGMAKFFYITYKNEHPDEEVDAKLFTYPGPNPESKEEAILMMCDSVEAASRSLGEYTEDSISNLVDKIIDGQVKEGFFNESDITFKDIATAKAVLKDKLKTIYHTRISYPELNNAKQN